MRLIEAHLLTYLCMCTVMASDKAATDPQGARTLGRASYIVSSVGIGFAIVAIIIIIRVAAASNLSSCVYLYNGACYDHFSSYVSRELCPSHVDGVYDDYKSGCYYNGLH